jgi:hypothetical protein
MKQRFLLLATLLLSLSVTNASVTTVAQQQSSFTCKTRSGYPGGYSLALWIGLNKYYITFNEDLTYIGAVQEYYTGRFCDINSQSCTLITDDDYSPYVTYSLSFNDHYYWGTYSSFPETLTPSGSNVMLWYYGHS